MEYPKATSLHELLQQHNANLLAVSDGRADAGLNLGSFGWVLDTNEEILWECKSIARGYPMISYRAEGYRRISVLSFFDALPSIPRDPTPCCVSFHTATTPVSWTKRNLFTLEMLTRQACTQSLTTISSCSALRANHPFRLAPLHVHGHQHEKCDFDLLPRPAQLDVLADRIASEVLTDFRAATTPTAF
jgi:hypothetical protein